MQQQNVVLCITVFRFGNSIYGDKLANSYNAIFGCNEDLVLLDDQHTKNQSHYQSLTHHSPAATSN
jgi:hypothetical protein